MGICVRLPTSPAATECTRRSQFGNESLFWRRGWHHQRVIHLIRRRWPNHCLCQEFLPEAHRKVWHPVLRLQVTEHLSVWWHTVTRGKMLTTFLCNSTEFQEDSMIISMCLDYGEFWSGYHVVCVCVTERAGRGRRKEGENPSPNSTVDTVSKIRKYAFSTVRE